MVAEVRDQLFSAGRLCRDSLLNIPDRVAALIAAESDQKKIQDILRSEIDPILEDFLKSLKAVSR